MKLVIIFGPQAVGKMTVGKELAALTGMRLFHNHMTIELVNPFFDYGTQTGRVLVKHFREEIFKSVAESDLPGLIFTYVWSFSDGSDKVYIEEISKLFTDRGGEVFLVELQATVEERVRRNRTDVRLQAKPSKQDVARSEAELLKSMDHHRLNSYPGELDGDNYLRIDNTNLEAAAVATRIKEHFGW